MKKAYIETGFGQIHCRISKTENDQAKTMVLLHPMPFSGLFYNTVTPTYLKHIPSSAPITRATVALTVSLIFP